MPGPAPAGMPAAGPQRPACTRPIAIDN